MTRPIRTCLRSLSGWSKLTPFTQSVLAATFSIPKGQTRTYKQVAKMIGKPKAFRAVGSVMRKNPYAPHVPCHRVVKSDGSLGNYSAKGGKKMKKLLLMREGALPGRNHKLFKILKHE